MRYREEFVSIMAQEGVPLNVIRSLMRAAATLHRLAEDECNGVGWRDSDMPGGPRHYLRISAPGPMQTACGEAVASAENVPVTIRATKQWSRVTCPSCQVTRVELRITRICASYTVAPIVPIFNGDPRGAVLKLKVPSGRTNDLGQEGVCVP